MSIIKYIVLHCDECGEVMGSDNTIHSKRLLKKRAKEFGCTFKNKMDRCEECSNKTPEYSPTIDSCDN